MHASDTTSSYILACRQTAHTHFQVRTHSCTRHTYGAARTHCRCYRISFCVRNTLAHIRETRILTHPPHSRAHTHARTHAHTHTHTHTDITLFYTGVNVVQWNGVPVAAKAVHKIIVNPRIRGLVQQEIDSCCRIRHPNIVTVFGAITDDDKPPQLLMEIMEGSVSDVIQAARANYLTMREQVDIMRDCAAGINYMHSLTPPLLHGDIRSENVLVTPNMTAKLGDLGAAHIENASKSAGPLSLNYLAPERKPDVVRGTAIHNTPAADMFTFGLLNIEIITGSVPAWNERSKAVRGIRQDRLRAMCQQMIEERPHTRPDCTNILQFLLEMTQTTQCTECEPKRRVQRKREKGVDLLH